MTEAERVETPEVSFSLSGEELTLRDEAGGGEVQVEVDGDTSLTPASEDWFDVPMDGAVSLEVSSLRVRGNVLASLRDANGEHRGTLTGREFSIHADGTYVEISAAMKIVVYMERGTVSGSLDGDLTDFSAVTFDFEEPTEVVVGARSFHEEPAVTMTVPDEPTALMEAASYLGSSIKEWSAERSWSTLRGHPPAIEAGDTLDIPSDLSKPDTGVEIGVEQTVESVLRVTPLAHYLGADVVPSDRTELRVGGYSEPLGASRALEQSVDDLLARCLLLDSLVRIGGYYSHSRHEYDELAPTLPFYPPELYDEPIDRQLLEYLEVPFDDLAPWIPDWPVVGTLRPEIRDVEAVPHLLNSSARIHVTDDGQPRTADPTPAIDRPIQLSTTTAVPPGVSSLTAASRVAATGYERHAPAEVSALFVGDAPRPENRFDRTDWDRFDVEGTPTADYRDTVTTAELVAAFRDDHLYIHYGNRVTNEGFVCSDGTLPFDELPSADAGVVSFQWGDAETSPVTGVLNAAEVGCLLDEPIGADAARRFGKYLTLGHSLALSTRLAGFADEARFLGDGSRSLVQRPNGGPPAVFSAEAVGRDRYRVWGRIPLAYTDNPGRLIGLFSDESAETFSLSGNPVEWPKPLTTDELADIAESGDHVWFDNPPKGFPYETVIETGEPNTDSRKNLTEQE